MMKVKMKISGGFRDKTTAEAVALIRSYISTIRKNGDRVIEAIASAFQSNPRIPCKEKNENYWTRQEVSGNLFSVCLNS